MGTPYPRRNIGARYDGCAEACLPSVPYPSISGCESGESILPCRACHEPGLKENRMARQIAESHNGPGLPIRHSRRRLLRCAGPRWIDPDAHEASAGKSLTRGHHQAPPMRRGSHPAACAAKSGSRPGDKAINTRWVYGCDAGCAIVVAAPRPCSQVTETAYIAAS